MLVTRLADRTAAKDRERAEGSDTTPQYRTRIHPTVITITTVEPGINADAIAAGGDSLVANVPGATRGVFTFFFDYLGAGWDATMH